MEQFKPEKLKKENPETSAGYILQADELYEKNPSLEKLIPAIMEYLDAYYKQLKNRAKPQSIVESRLTSPKVAFEKGMWSCGIHVNIVTEMLRHLGFEVKKIHGSVPDSIDHAWIKAKDPKTGAWEEFDFSYPDCKVTPEHKIIAECDEWSEIDDKIKKAHQDFLDKKNNR